LQAFSAQGNFMKTRTHLLLLCVLSFLTACASYNPVPPGYTGPVAVIHDSTEAEGGTKGRLFFVEEIDGNRIDNARTETRRASQGRGFALTTNGSMRTVPVKSMRLKLIGTHVVAAPIHEMASRAIGTFFEVEGVIEFTPKPNGTYRVRGELKKNASTVWIEDDETREMVTAKITGK
jgi:hypothetical protein